MYDNIRPTVGYGSKVTVRREFTLKPQTYHILTYTDLACNVISVEHPIAKALMHHAVGDKVLIDDPKTYYFVEILEVVNPGNDKSNKIYY